MANKNNAVSARAFRNKKAKRANADKQKKKKATSGADVAKTISKAATTARRTGDETQQSYINDSKLKRNGKQAQKNNDIVVGRSKQQTKKRDKFQTRASIKDNEYAKKASDNIKGLTKGNLRQVVASHVRSLGVASENMTAHPMSPAANIAQNDVAKQVREKEKETIKAKQDKNPISEWASKQLEKSAKEIEKQKKGMNEAGKFAADVYGAGLGLATDALAGPFATASMFSRSFGSAYDSAEKEGATKGQAALYGATIGGVEAATEKLFAVAKPLQKIYGKGAADDLTERVLNKMVGKHSGTGKGDLLYHGGKTFAAALTEGLEEMIAEGLEPTIANQIYADALGKHKETDPGQVLYAGAVGGALGGILGGGGQVVEYSQGAQVRDIYGEEGVADMLKKAVESDDAADAVKATAMKAMVDNGDGIVAGQANQLKQAVDAQNVRDTERLQLASDSAVKIMRDNKYIDIVQKIDENGTLELSEHTRTAYEDTKDRAVQEFENNTELQLPEQTVDQITSAIASIKTGAVMDIDAVNMFTLNNPEARAVYETVTGETLPKTNAETRDYLYLKIAENRVSSAEAETNYFVDRLRGVLEQDIATTYDAKGQEAFSDVIAHINPANAGQVQASIVTFEDYYEAGRRGESLEFMNSLDNPVYNALPAEVRKAAYEAGSMDQNASVASAKGVALQLGQKAEFNRSQTKSGGQRGKVISKLSKENRSRFTAQQQIMYRKLAQVFNINIEITDDPNMNGFYDNGTITLSVNADRDLAYVFAHEITHHMELYAPEEYLRFKDLVRSSWDYDGLNGAIDAKIRHYADHGVKLSREGALDEILADSTYEMIQDENFVEELCREDRGMAKAILDALKVLIKKLRAVLVDGNKFTPAQNEGLLSQLDILKDAEKLWVDGLMKAAENSDAVSAVEDTGAVKYQLKPYTEKQRENWENSNIIIYENEAQLIQFIEDAKKGLLGKKKMYFGIVPDNLAKDVMDKTGIDITNRNITLGAYEVIKIFKDHGNDAKEQLRGQRAVEISDFKNIVSIIESPDKIKLEDKTYNGRPVLSFEKEVDGKVTVVTYDSAKHMDLRVQTMFAHKKRSLATATDDQASVNTSETTSGTAPVNIISKSPENGNKKFSLKDSGDSVSSFDLFMEALKYSSKLRDIAHADGYDSAHNYIDENFDNSGLKKELHFMLSMDEELDNELALEDWINEDENDFNDIIPEDAIEVMEDITEAEITYQPVVKTNEYIVDLNKEGARFTEERIDTILREYGSSNKDYAKAYVTSINPDSFLKLTLSEDVRALWNENVEKNNDLYDLDVEKLKGQTQTPFLIIDNDGNVEGHEGRHRMRALFASGIKNVPIVVINYNTKYNKQKENAMVLSTQEYGDGPVNDGYRVEVNDLIPTNEVYREDIVKKYGGNAALKFSFKDSTGRELSPQQAEFFKDSKVRDENGNLLVMYHGTDSYEDFNVFKSGKAGYLGKGMYFSDSESYAKRYATKNGYDGRVYETYLNVKNPLVVTSENPAVEILGEKLAARREKNNSFSTTWIKPSDIKKLVDKGYDGIIWKYGPTIEVSVWNPNQIKNIDNENPTDNPDIRYSLKDNKGRELSPAQQEYFKHVSPKLKDEDGNLKRYHHGTSRGDRVGTIFDPERATSGPMPFFTDDFDIATNYSRDKRDTSMAYDSDYYSYETQFRVEIDGDDMSLIDAWRYLPGDARERIKDRAEHTHYDWDDYETLVYDEDTNDAGGGFQWQIKEARGNIFRALCEQWLNSGTLFNNEAEYMNVLEFVGVNEEFEKLGYGKPYYKDPDYREEKVYEVYLNITNPFDTADVDEEFLADLTDYIENTDMSIYDVDTADADPWDKRNWDPEEWLEKLERDIEEGTAYAWTSIPDVVTDFLKDYLEADGIVDTGGKRGGQTHQVVIPFYSEQIKNIDNENPTNDPDIRYSFKDDIDEDAVNNYVNEHPEDFPDSIPYWEYERDAARVKDQTIGELRNQVTRMKLDKLLTHGRVLDTSSVKEEVNSLVRMLMTSAEGTTAKTNLKLVDQITENVQGIYRTLKAGNEEDAIIDAYNLAEDIVENLQLVNDEMFYTYKDLRDYLRTTKVYISEEDKSNIPDFKDFRRRNMGRLLIVNEGNGGTSIDNMYTELCQMYPGMFDEELTHPADQLQEIADVRESLEPYDIVLNDEETIQLIKETAHDLIEIAAHGKPWVSWADRNKEAYGEKIKALKQKQKEAIRDIKRKERDRYDAKLAAQEAKADERVQKVKEKGEEKLQAEKDKNKQQRQDQREERKKKELIRKMEKNIQWLSDRLLKPTDDKHLPEGYQRAIAQLLYAIDTQTARSKQLEEKYGLSQKKLKLLALKEEYKKIAENSESGIVLDEEIENDLAELGALLDDYTISDASAEQVEIIYKVLRNIVHGIQHINKAFNERLKENYDELANETIFVAEHKKKRHDRSGLLGGLDTLLNESMVTPRDFFMRIGGGLNKTFLQIRKGMDDHVDNLTVTRDFFDQLFEPYRKKTQIRKRNKPGSIVEDWRDSSTNEEFELESGGTIKLNVAQRMSLYCLMKRDQAVGHIMGSGIVASEVDAKSKFKQWAGAKKEVNSITSRVTWPDVEKIIGTLTQEQVEMADKLMDFLNNECAAWGNKASMKLFGYEKFTEENYFPIQSADVYLDSKFEGRTSVERIRNFGFTKGTVTNANNPIVIDDIFSVVADHVNKMSMYSAFAVPIADFTRVYNYKTRNEDGTLDKSVQAVLANTFGEKVDRYVNNFMADLQSNTQMRTEGFTRLMNKTLANYKKATIGMNIRVALQQPTAIMRTFIMLDPKYFLNGNVNVAKNLKDMKEHCQIARWKSWGHNQVDMARDIDEIMMNREFTRFDYLSMGIYGSLDNVTWSVIWAAVRKEVQAKHPHVVVDSEEFYDLCNERASEIYDRTQVVDSVMHRSQVMRNTDTMSKVLTSFMAEPTRTFNMIRSEFAAALDMARDGDKARAGKKVAKAAIVYLMNAFACAAAAAVADALRGKDLDDDDEPEKWFEHTLKNFITNANPLNLLPVAKEISSIWNGWGTQNMALEGMASFIESAKAFTEKATGNNDDSWETVLMDLGEGFGLMFGIPIKNMRRDIKALAGLLGIEVSAATVEDEPAEEKEKLLDRAFDGMGIKDGSNIDKTLNFFGLNRTDAEQAAYERERTVKALNKQTKNMSDKERADHVWGEVMSGYKKDLETGNIQAVIERRKILEAAGGDVDKFDKNVLGETKTAFKKTIGDPDKAEAAAVLRDYLKTEYGYTDAKISNELLTKTDTAKEFQLALCTNDQATAISTLYDLVEAGLTYEDYCALYLGRASAIQGSDYSTGEFNAPVTGTVTSTFGYRDAPTAGASTYHQGIDIAAPEGTVVGAADGGKVSSVGYSKTKGNYVTIDHGNGRYTEYLHLWGYNVQKGDAVLPGQEIGRVGSTGVSTGPHLHFAVKESGTYVDPAGYIGL